MISVTNPALNLLLGSLHTQFRNLDACASSSLWTGNLWWKLHSSFSYFNSVECESLVFLIFVKRFHVVLNHFIFFRSSYDLKSPRHPIPVVGRKSSSNSPSKRKGAQQKKTLVLLNSSLYLSVWTPFCFVIFTT